MHLEEDDFTDLWGKYKQPLSKEDLLAYQQQQNKEEEIEPEPSYFTV